MSIFSDKADFISMTRMLDILAVSVILFWLDIVIVMNKLFTRYYYTGILIDVLYFQNISTISGWYYIFMPRRIIYIFVWYNFIWNTPLQMHSFFYLFLSFLTTKFVLYMFVYFIVAFNDETAMRIIFH